MPNSVTVDPAKAVSLVVCTYTFDRLAMLRHLLDTAVSYTHLTLPTNREV